MLPVEQKIESAQVLREEVKNWLVWFDQRVLTQIPFIRRFITAYFLPNKVEQYRRGLIYRLLGIQFIAWIIPTGGMLWRRLFKWKGWSFAMDGSSLKAAGEYRYSICVFEILHTVVLIIMIPDGIWAIKAGYTDGILKFVLAGLLMNGYPILLQRYNRVRIQYLLDKAKNKKIRGKRND